LVVALLTWGESARAQDDRVAVRPTTISVDERLMLRVSVSYRDVVDGDTAAKLAGGLPTTIVFRAYVFREPGSRALLVATFKTCCVNLDLWDEIYRIEMSQNGEPDTTIASPTLDGVLRRCAEADRLSLVARSALPSPATYYVACVVEVNPVSPDMLERIKRWVSRPAGTGAAAPGDALFGSFVGLFVARIGSADRQISFRSQPFSL